jgi:hypothetical protein
VLASCMTNTALEFELGDALVGDWTRSLCTNSPTRGSGAGSGAGGTTTLAGGWLPVAQTSRVLQGGECRVPCQQRGSSAVGRQGLDSYQRRATCGASGQWQPWPMRQCHRGGNATASSNSPPALPERAPNRTHSNSEEAAKPVSGSPPTAGSASPHPPPGSTPNSSVRAPPTHDSARVGQELDEAGSAGLAGPGGRTRPPQHMSSPGTGSYCTSSWSSFQVRTVASFCAD